MKKITLLLILLTVSLGYSQTLIEDFETTLADGVIVGDGVTSALQVVNPDIVCENDSATVLEIITDNAGVPWQNGQLYVQNTEAIDLSGANKIVEVDVYYMGTPTYILAKAVDGPGGGPTESATDALHPGDGWNTLYFDFSNSKDSTPAGSEVYGRILFFPAWNGGGFDGNGAPPYNTPVSTTYYDNITKGVTSSSTLIEDFEATLADGVIVGDGVTSALQVANPDNCNNDSATVLEIITDNAGVPWQNGQLYVQNTEAIDLSGANKIVEVDVYYMGTPTYILAKAVDGPGGGPTESATDALHPGDGWNTLYFDFSNSKDSTPAGSEVYGRILFFPAWNGGGFDGNGAPPYNTPVSTTYYDNITKAVTLGIKDYQLIDFKTYPNPTRNSWTVKTKNEKMSSIRVYSVLGKQVLSLSPNDNEAKINGSSLKTGIYFAQIKTDSGISSLKLIKQ